jgi:NADH-quinone oxidoreductase subunit A
MEVPSTPLEVYFPLLVQALIGLVLAIGLVAASSVLGKKLENKVKNSPYECGMAPQGSAEERFSVKFYLVAMLFILFDIEAVFLYPWVVVYKDLGWVAFVEMGLFVALILSGFLYIWKKGVLDWSKTTQIIRK